MKKTIFILFVVFVALFTGCSKEESRSSMELIKDRGFIKIGVFSDKPPFGYVDANGKNQGYDVFFAKRIAKELFGDENKVEFHLVEAASRVEFLTANKVDIILANFTVTPERAQVVDFALPYMKVSLGIATPKDAKIENISELKDKTLLVNKGTTADAYFTKNNPEIKLLKFDQNTETFSALLDKRGEALAHDNTLLFAWTKENPEFVVSIPSIGGVDFIAPAVKKGNKELLDYINLLIEKLGDEQFFHKNYDATLRPVYGDSVKPDDVVVERGKI